MIVSNLRKQLSGKEILKDISFTLSQKDKVGLVGANGSGKSTLLKTLSGELENDFGTIKTNGETIGYLKQEIIPDYDDFSIIEYLKKETKIEELEKRLHALEENLTEENMEEYGLVQSQFLALDGYMFEENLLNILSGLHFNKSLSCKIGTLSGGEKIKILLAALLLKNDDIILLDEPTNNLDVEAIEWLENYLKQSNKKMIIISHDEVFLNNIVNKIFELKNGTIREYNLSYKDYLKQKREEYNKEKEEYLKAQEEKEKLKKQVQKAKEWANKGTSKKNRSDNDKIANNFALERTNTKNISRLSKSLENLEIPEFEEKVPIKVFFSFNNSKGNKDIILENLICGYSDFKTPEINIVIPFGTRVRLSGGNGSGKTTVIKTILNEIRPAAGNVKIGNEAKIGYISQNTLSTNNEESIYSYLIKQNPGVDKAQIFILLDKFNISYDEKDKPYSLLSPGERTRVNLVKLALEKINILILDEITNHLDKEALDLIYELVDGYEGTIISVSHNRKYNEYLNEDVEIDISTGEVKHKIGSRRM